MRSAALLLTAAIVLTGCDNGYDHTDPRKGRVDLGHSNCLYGGCYQDWKVCSGPDLYIYVANKPRWIRNSPECEAN